MICPLMSYRYEDHTVECKEKDCAWWIEKVERIDKVTLQGYSKKVNQCAISYLAIKEHD